MSRKFAVFDIDGTLIRWQLYHAVADELARRGHFGAIEYEAVKRARMTWKQRAHDDSFKTYEQALVNLVDQAIVGLAQVELQSACRTVISEYKDQVYTYTRDLVRQLKDQHYLLFTISASQQDVVKLLAEYYGFDDWGGSEYEVKDGYFTGKKEILKSERKPEYLQQLVTKHGTSYSGSIAVGDSESDIPMLNIVEQPIAFNPTKQLFEHATARGWNIVVERKNVVYTLGEHHGSYILAQTDK
ncbi:MAG TPA: HAD-IB family hydrolase [Candidatus Saccharimonadales bacterium]|nr:HAD-IB family hydrolase [Candidatus Saccharimonadales bacterium]